MVVKGNNSVPSSKLHKAGTLKVQGSAWNVVNA